MCPKIMEQSATCIAQVELYRELQKGPYCAFQKHADSKIQSSTDNVVGTVLDDLIRSPRV